MKIPERNKGYKEGLINFCNYINNITPTKDLTILEIGSWTGVGMEIFANRFKEVTCIDPWVADKKDSLTIQYNVKAAEQIFNNRMKKYKNVTKLKGGWEDFIDKFISEKKMFDVVYVDMNKIFEDNLDCIIAFYPLTDKYISGHDYEKRFPGVVKAVNKAVGKPQKVFKDTSWIIKII
jgi:hypothetical protein